MRLFVALDLTAAVRSELHDWSAGLDDTTWRQVPEANLHVTLAFLGERPDADLAKAGGVVVRCAGAAAPVLRCAGVVALPPRRPKLLAVRLEEAETEARSGGVLASLQAQVAGELVRAGVYEPERRPFLAHVTAARARRDGDGGAPATSWPAAPTCVFEPPTVTLFASRPEASGVRYEALTTAQLRGCRRFA